MATYDAFLSYARGDDEPFVRRLHAALTAHGLRVWFDRADMPNRGLAFTREIANAIEQSERLLLVVGPKALASKYVEAEWRYGLRLGKPVHPLMRSVGPEALPPEVRGYDARDFRKDEQFEAELTRLEAQMRDLSAPGGRLYGDALEQAAGIEAAEAHVLRGSRAEAPDREEDAARRSSERVSALYRRAAMAFGDGRFPEASDLLREALVGCGDSERAELQAALAETLNGWAVTEVNHASEGASLSTDRQATIYQRAFERLKEARALDPGSSVVVKNHDTLQAMLHERMKVVQRYGGEEAFLLQQQAVEAYNGEDFYQAIHLLRQALARSGLSSSGTASEGSRQLRQELAVVLATTAVRELNEISATGTARSSHLLAQARAMAEEAAALDPENRDAREILQLLRGVPRGHTPTPERSSAAREQPPESTPPERGGPEDDFARVASLSGEDSVRDRVDCTVFAPPEVAAGTRLMLQVWVHTAVQADIAREAATEFDPGATRRRSVALPTEIVRGDRLAFELIMDQLQVEDTVQHLVWRGRAEGVAFRVRAPQDASPGTTFGRVLVYQRGLPIGEIAFQLRVTPVNVPARSDPAPAGEATRYRQAFISYASTDRPEVQRRVQMLPLVGISFFQDQLHLEPGQLWEEELFRRIDASDVMFLFWSTAAKGSPWVQREWRYALEQKGIGFIRPVMIEGPPPVTPPAELKQMQFNDPRLPFIWAADQARANPPREGLWSRLWRGLRREKEQP